MIQQLHSWAYIQKRHMHPIVQYSTIYSGQNVEATSVSIHRWMNKDDVVHICYGILLSHKKWKNAICTNMDGPRDDHIKWSK